MLEIDQPGAEVLVDGQQITVNVPGDNKPVEIKVVPGQHKLRISKEGFVAVTQEIELKAGKSGPIRVRLQPNDVARGKPIGEEKKDQTPRPTAPIDPKIRRASRTFFGDWTIDGGEILENQMVGNPCLVFGDSAWKDHDFTCEAKRVKGRNFIHLLYHVTGAGFSVFGIGASSVRDPNETLANAFSVHRDHWTLAKEIKSRAVQVQSDSWNKLMVRIRGKRCQCYLNDQLILEYEDSKNTQGAVGFMPFNTAARFRNIRVTDPTGKVLFEGLPELPAQTSQWPPATEPASASEIRCLEGHGAPVTSVAFSRDGGQVLSASNGECIHWIGEGEGGWWHTGPGSTIQLWDARQGKKMTTLRSLARCGGSLSWPARELPFFLSATHLGSKVQLWEIAGRQLESRHIFPEKTEGTIDLAFSPDGRWALALGTTGTFWEWDLMNDKKLLRQVPGDLKDVTCTAVAPDCRLSLLARNNKPFAEIDFTTAKETGRWKDTVGVVRSLAFSPDSRRALSGGEDGTVRLWDVVNAKQLHRFSAHQRPVLAVAFSPDGRRAPHRRRRSNGAPVGPRCQERVGNFHGTHGRDSSCCLFPRWAPGRIRQCGLYGSDMAIAATKTRD